MTDRSLQETYAEHSVCFGCGPANASGLRIRSFVVGDVLECRFTPAPHHHAFPGVLNGGIIGTLLDCHSNWAAVAHRMGHLPLRGQALSLPRLEKAPCCVTADFAIKLKRPTSMAEVVLRSWVVASETLDPEANKSALARMTISATLEAGGKVTATCDGTFVEVGPGHPAHHRW